MSIGSKLTYIENGDMSASVNGDSVTAQPNVPVTFEASWDATGAPLGTIKIQGANRTGVWHDVADSDQAVTGGADSWARTLREPGFKFLRVVFAQTGGGAANTSLSASWFQG